MRTLVFIALAWCAHAQTCAYNTGKFPNGAVLVYRNGAIQRQGTDFSFKVTAGVPTITPINWAPGDHFSTVFSIQVPLTLSTGTAYTSFRVWQENWDCPGAAAAQPFIIPTATFATPPTNPQLNQAFMFTDASAFDSCAGGGDGNSPQVCYWTGTKWSAPSGGSQPAIATQAILGGRRSVRWLECYSGIVDKTLLTAAAASQEVTILTGLTGAARFEHITICEHDQFLGAGATLTNPAAGVTVSMGRPGPTNDYELSGAVVPLGVNASNQGCWSAQPSAPQFSGNYSVVLNFSAAPGLITDISSGSVEWEACIYPSLIGDPGVISTPAKLIGLQQCTGSGPGWDCTGMYSAKVKRADGSVLPIVGPMMTPAAGPAVWTDVK